MAYAELKDVKARAGRLRQAWDDSTEPGNAEIELFIRDASNEIDAFIAARGYATPVTDTTAIGALLPIVADIALLQAVESTWPGGQGPQAVSDLMTRLDKKVASYRDAMAQGNLVVLLLLTSKDSAQEGGAASFMDTDASTYDYWSRFVGRWARSWAQDPWGTPPSSQPEFRKSTTRF